MSKTKVAHLNSLIFLLLLSVRSDSANLDAVFELMTKSRHRAPCALMSLVPTAYMDEPALADNPEIVDFYKFHGGLLEAWDGPALSWYTVMASPSALASTATVSARPDTVSLAMALCT